MEPSILKQSNLLACRFKDHLVWQWGIYVCLVPGVFQRPVLSDQIHWGLPLLQWVYSILPDFQRPKFLIGWVQGNIETGNSFSPQRISRWNPVICPFIPFWHSWGSDHRHSLRVTLASFSVSCAHAADRPKKKTQKNRWTYLVFSSFFKSAPSLIRGRRTQNKRWQSSVPTGWRVDSLKRPQECDGPWSDLAFGRVFGLPNGLDSEAMLDLLYSPSYFSPPNLGE